MFADLIRVAPFDSPNLRYIALPSGTTDGLGKRWSVGDEENKLPVRSSDCLALQFLHNLCGDAARVSNPFRRQRNSRNHRMTTATVAFANLRQIVCSRF